MKIITGHISYETAYKIENYPWGFKLRTTQYIWIETVKKKGDRVVRQTIDPRTGKLCAAKCSTFSNIKWLYIDDNGHVQSSGLSIYNKREEVIAAIEKVGIDNLLPEQRIQYNSLLGINEVKVDEFTGKAKKDFTLKWERETIGNGWIDGKWNEGEKGNYIELKITFDRPDGVSLKEIYKAMKSVDQEKLNQVFAERPSISAGTKTGTVRICCRGGSYLGEISEESYKNWLASDANVIEEEGQL